MMGIWISRWSKALTFILNLDWKGLGREIKQFLIWKTAAIRAGHNALHSEAKFWARVDWERMRRASWGSIQCLGPMAVRAMTGGLTDNIDYLIAQSLPVHEKLRGLVLGCGDMKAEHTVFTNPYLKFEEIDAYDINPSVFDQARQTASNVGLKVNFYVADVNTLELPPNAYHMVVIFHSYHHFREVERIAAQINQTLVPGGLFYTFDYIGPRRLQYTDSQLRYAQLVLEILPDKYRRQIDGTTRIKIERVPINVLSPEEAINSDHILPAIQKHLQILWRYDWAGLLYPLLEGIAHNFDETLPDDRALIEALFTLDMILCKSGLIEPNFTIILATKK